jgi:rod shape-determining protein MreC
MSPMVKKKGEKFTIPVKYLLLILTIACAAMIIITYNTETIGEPVNQFAGIFVIPFEKGISSAGSYLSSRSEQLAQINDLLDQNAKLKKQVNDLTNENTKLQQDKYELSTLQQLYKLSSQYDEYKTTGARVIAKDSGNWFNSFVIDKGSADGIKNDMNVMAGSGLVGRVVDVGSNWAKVKSIIADDSNVSAMVLSNSDQMIVSGSLEEYAGGSITFSQLVDDKNEVNAGDKVVTSNISDKYLPGILIGYITEIGMDSNNLTKSGKITPAVDFSHITEVLVILENKQTDGNKSLSSDQGIRRSVRRHPRKHRLLRSSRLLWWK